MTALFVRWQKLRRRLRRYLYWFLIEESAADDDYDDLLYG